MSSYNPVIKDNPAGAVFYVSLLSQANTLVFQSNPTISSGDVQISIDGGALANLGTLPTVVPASSKLVKVTLAQAETNGDNLAIVFSSAGSQWCDLMVNIQTTANNFDTLPVVSADALLDRNMATGTDSGSATVRTVRQALRFLRNKWDVSGTTLSVYKETDATVSWQSTLTGTSGASPVTESDPAGGAPLDIETEGGMDILTESGQDITTES